MGQSVHFVEDLGSGHEGGGKFKIRQDGRHSSYTTADE